MLIQRGLTGLEADQEIKELYFKEFQVELDKMNIVELSLERYLRVLMYLRGPTVALFLLNRFHS